MEITTWSDVVRGLDIAFEFARPLGLNDAVAGSRFAAYREQIDHLAWVREREGDSAAFDRFMSDPELSTVALAESVELVTVLPYLRSLDPKIAGRKLKIALRGPQRPADEDPNSNEARNTMFELNIGARLHRAGLAVDTGQDADLEFTCAGVRWFGECKRPYRIESIPANLAAACRQVDRRLATSRLAARGLIAVSISRPVATRAAYLTYSGETELRAALKLHGTAAVQLVGGQLQQNEPGYTPWNLGLLVVHLMMPAWDTTARIPTTVQHSAGMNLCRDKEQDANTLWRTIEGTFGTTP